MRMSRKALTLTAAAGAAAVAAAVIPLATGTASAATASPATAGVVPTPAHVVVVMEENHAYSQVIGSSSAPYINSLANSGALMTQSFGVTHPSEPNYMALFGGSTFGLSSDKCPVSEGTTANLGSELLASGKTFVGYSEGLPSAGSTVCTSGKYARKHSPWVNYSNVPGADSVPFTSFPTNYANLPTLSFVIPNLNDDMHDGTVAAGDTWLKNNLSAYATWAKANNSLLIVTWDEDDSAHGNQIATIFYGARVKPGQYATAVTHYNVLRTLESMYALPPMNNAATAAPIDYVWTTSSTPPPPPGVPAAPTNLTARPSTSVANAIDLAWKDNASDETGYRIERSTDGTNFYPLAGTGPNATANRNTSLTPGKRYYYRVYAVNAAGRSPYSNTASAVLPTAAIAPALTPSPFSTRALIPEDPLWA